MWSPDGRGPHDGEVPNHDEAVCIAADETLILPNKAEGVDLCFMTSENRRRMRRPGHVLVEEAVDGDLGDGR